MLTGCDPAVCPAGSNSDLAAFAASPICREIRVVRTDLTDLEGLQGADKAIYVLDNDRLTDVSAIDSATSVDIRDNPALTVIRAVSSNHYISSGDTPRELHLGLLPPLPNDPDDPAEAFPEPHNTVNVTHGRRGPDVLEIFCAQQPCHAWVNIVSDTFDGLSVSVGGVAIVRLGIGRAQLTSWEFLQGFGVPVEEIRLSAPQDLAIIRAWRAWLDDNGFTGSLATCATGQECVEVSADGS